MTRLTEAQIAELRQATDAALVVSSGWQTQHDDTYVFAEKIPKEHDWYWVIGQMEANDDDLRGPKSVIQAHCRYVAQANPAVLTALLDDVQSLQKAKSELSRECDALRGQLEEKTQLLQAALTYDPMIDHYKLKELHVRFRKALGGAP